MSATASDLVGLLTDLNLSLNLHVLWKEAQDLDESTSGRSIWHGILTRFGIQFKNQGDWSSHILLTTISWEITSINIDFDPPSPCELSWESDELAIGGMDGWTSYRGYGYISNSPSFSALRSQCFASSVCDSPRLSPLHPYSMAPRLEVSFSSLRSLSTYTNWEFSLI